MNTVHAMAKRRTMNPEAKRSRIMSCGERLFAEQGYTNTTMADIAAAADVAVGTVYRIFPDKPSLLAALHSRMEDAFIQALTEGWERAASYEQKFGTMIESLFDEAAEVIEIMPLYSMTRDMIGAADYRPGERMIEVIETLYAQGVEAGAYRRIPPYIQSHIAHAMVEGAMRAWMMKPDRTRRRQIVNELEAIMKRGFLL